MLEIDSNNPKIAFRRPEHGAYLHPYLHQDITKLDMLFDHAQIKQLVIDVFQQFETANKARFQTYGGIGLQYAEGFDEYYDTLQDLQHLQVKRRVHDGDFRHLNPIGQKFKFIFDQFAQQGIQLTRSRLLVARPGHLHEPHYDYDFRIHIPVTTNPHCEAIFGNKTYHLDADGSCYLHNGYHRHTFRNHGQTDRIHFIAGIEGFSLLHRALQR